MKHQCYVCRKGQNHRHGWRLYFYRDGNQHFTCGECQERAVLENNTVVELLSQSEYAQLLLTFSDQELQDRMRKLEKEIFREEVTWQPRLEVHREVDRRKALGSQVRIPGQLGSPCGQLPA